MVSPQRRHVICLALGRITWEGRYLLTADRTRYRQSRGAQRIWGAPSGVIEVLPSDMHSLGLLLDAKTATAETVKLSFTVPIDKLPIVADWFATHPPHPEHSRELIVQHLSEPWHGTTPLLLHPDISNAAVSLGGQASMDIKLARPGPHAHQKTHYRLWVFDLELTPKALAAIHRVMQQPRPPLKFVTEAEIMYHRTTDDEEITPFAQHLVWASQA